MEDAADAGSTPARSTNLDTATNIRGDGSDTVSFFWSYISFQRPSVN